VPAGWTPDQIRQFQDYRDTEFVGDLAKRRRAKFVPGESAVKVHQTKEPEHKQDFDEWLARIICYAFSVPPQWAVKLMNRATADNQSAQAEEERLEPTKEWVKDLVDEIIADEFASPDLELAWLDEDTGAAQAEAALEARVKIGAATLNELRDALGLEPFQNPAADRPMVLTATGYVPIEAGAGGNASPPFGARSPKEQSAANASFAYQKAAAEDPKHPGWPAGTSDGKGGQFRPKDAENGGGVSGSPPDASGRITKPGAQYAARETGTQTDAPGAIGHDGQENLAAQDGSFVGQFWVTRNPKIDQTSFVLLALFGQAVDQVGPRGNLSPSEYGTKIHTEFPALVRAEGMVGVKVEQTFSADPNAVYGAEGSIRTDVILSDWRQHHCHL
jgi:hypothetical protein